MLHQAVDSADVRDKVPEIREQHALVEIWNDLGMANFVAGDSCELKNVANENVEVIAKRGIRWFVLAPSGGVTAEQMAEMVWIKSKVVAQIRFEEWTNDGHLRHAAFLGLRTDKPSKDIRRE